MSRVHSHDGWAVTRPRRRLLLYGVAGASLLFAALMAMSFRRQIALGSLFPKATASTIRAGFVMDRGHCTVGVSTTGDGWTDPSSGWFVSGDFEEPQITDYWLGPGVSMRTTSQVLKDQTVLPWQCFVGTIRLVHFSREFLCATIAVLNAAVFLFSRLASSTKMRDGCCSRCGYCLAGNVSGVCPECGTSIGEKEMREPANAENM